MEGSTLKLIAIITMIMDHIGACILPQFFGYKGIYSLYIILRVIGRMSFPIFIFLLVEGFQHTRNRYRYALRLIIFAFISELPFDLAVSGTLIELSYQNVFFTLAIGMLVMIAMDEIQKLPLEPVCVYWLCCCIVIIGMGLAYVCRTDYGMFGVLAISTAYLLKGKRLPQIVLVCFVLSLMDLSEIFALAALVPIYFYNGKRGVGCKWLFYTVYPVHLLLFALINYMFKL